MHMQLFPPPLMHAVLHCNPTASRDCVRNNAGINHHKHTRMHKHAGTKMTSPCILLSHSILLYSLFCHRVKQRERVNVLMIFQPKLSRFEKRVKLLWPRYTVPCLWLGRRTVTVPEETLSLLTFTHTFMSFEHAR